MGQILHHKLFGDRGVVSDVAPNFKGLDAWSPQATLSRPPKDRLWYSALVHNSAHTSYVAERELALDDSEEPVHHPAISDFFAAFSRGRYLIRRPSN